jgi:hypothetical protein
MIELLTYNIEDTDLPTESKKKLEELKNLRIKLENDLKNLNLQLDSQIKNLDKLKERSKSTKRQLFDTMCEIETFERAYSEIIYRIYFKSLKDFNIKEFIGNEKLINYLESVFICYIDSDVELKNIFLEYLKNGNEKILFKIIKDGFWEKPAAEDMHRIQNTLFKTPIRIIMDFDNDRKLEKFIHGKLYVEGQVILKVLYSRKDTREELIEKGLNNAKRICNELADILNVNKELITFVSISERVIAREIRRGKFYEIHSPVEHIFRKNVFDISLEKFLKEHTDEEFTIKQLAQTFNVPHTSISSSILRLEELNLISTRRDTKLKKIKIMGDRKNE